MLNTSPQYITYTLNPLPCDQYSIVKVSTGAGRYIQCPLMFTETVRQFIIFSTSGYSGLKSGYHMYMYNNNNTLTCIEIKIMYIYTHM